MITVTKQTTQTVYQTVADATNPGRHALYTPDPGTAEPAAPTSASAAPAADKDCD